MFKVFADDDESNYWAKVALCIVIATLTLLALLGCSGKPDEEITAAAERAAYDKKITFIFPLEYTAKVSQCSVKDGCKTRYYYPRQR